MQNNLKETLRIATVPTETIGVSKAQSSAETASEMLEFTEDSRMFLCVVATLCTTSTGYLR